MTWALILMVCYATHDCRYEPQPGESTYLDCMIAGQSAVIEGRARTFKCLGKRAGEMET